MYLTDIMVKFLFILPFYLLTIGSSYAQTEATTADGRKILVYPDGTWKPANATESAANFHPTSISHLELPKANPHDQIINQ